MAQKPGSFAVDQTELWNGPLGDRWVRHQAMLDAILESYGRAAMERLPIGPQQRALDIGCGCGATSLELAERIGAGGAVLGIDLSRPMLAVARRRADERTSGAAITFEALNPEEQALPTQVFELAFSRFGVMFFTAPVKAFTNIRHALKADGHLAFVCWRSVGENPWMGTPMALAAQHVTPPPPPGPDEPGPFSMADPERIRRILGLAGFREIAIQPFDAPFRVAPAGDLEGALPFFMEAGPISLMLADATPEQRERVRESLLTGLEPLYGEDGLSFPGATWVVTARA